MWFFVRRTVTAIATLYLFVALARFSFVWHDGTAAVLAALMLGSFGVNIREQVLAWRALKEKQHGQPRS